MGKSKNQSAADNRFRGRSEHTLDEKGRLNIPSRFREILRHEYDDKLVVTNWHKYLRAYPMQVWQDIEATLLSQGKKQPGMDAFVRYVISGLTECPIDRQGRILLPVTLRTDLNIQRQVVLNGMLEHFEIWNKSAWESETLHTRETFSNFEQSLSNLGIL